MTVSSGALLPQDAAMRHCGNMKRPAPRATPGTEGIYFGA
jgi:hypothetical protein